MNQHPEDTLAEDIQHLAEFKVHDPPFVEPGQPEIDIHSPSRKILEAIWGVCRDLARNSPSGTAMNPDRHLRGLQVMLDRLVAHEAAEERSIQAMIDLGEAQAAVAAKDREIASLKAELRKHNTSLGAWQKRVDTRLDQIQKSLAAPAAVKRAPLAVNVQAVKERGDAKATTQACA